jgi:hypothetical protein
LEARIRLRELKVVGQVISGLPRQRQAVGADRIHRLLCPRQLFPPSQVPPALV